MTDLPHVGPLSAYPFHDWAKLQGTTVEVRREGMVVRHGLIDAVTADGTIVWLSQHGLLNRTLIDKTSGYELWIAPAELQRIYLLEQSQPERTTQRD